MIEPEVDKKLAGGSALHDLHHGVIDRILVLLQPAGDIIRHDTGIVRDGKVGILKYK